MRLSPERALRGCCYIVNVCSRSASRCVQKLRSSLLLPDCSGFCSLAGLPILNMLRGEKG